MLSMSEKNHGTTCRSSNTRKEEAVKMEIDLTSRGANSTIKLKEAVSVLRQSGDLEKLSIIRDTFQQQYLAIFSGEEDGIDAAIKDVQVKKMQELNSQVDTQLAASEHKLEFARKNYDRALKTVQTTHELKRLLHTAEQETSADELTDRLRQVESRLCMMKDSGQSKTSVRAAKAPFAEEKERHEPDTDQQSQEWASEKERTSGDAHEQAGGQPNKASQLGVRNEQRGGKLETQTDQVQQCENELNALRSRLSEVERTKHHDDVDHRELAYQYEWALWRVKDAESKLKQLHKKAARQDKLKRKAAEDQVLPAKHR
ncbi:hypothetical protein CB0940_11319 [Cercospora beticola]|uniref:Uncharacterized protein n=1 Tax=Cercospora beticola TaxID=122368 RepID=A0A2G5HEF5_CERBT|nr:hypothetical protein CB0940_11319 [Cercospora beticola]PIA90612.1 hypothetical protein CB0940_11319 [Cercospora beticola]WPB08159.1 hypothetical protein RHO25_012823 [Cercospora beticola]